jgi:hypothetical protein
MRQFASGMEARETTAKKTWVQIGRSGKTGIAIALAAMLVAGVSRPNLAPASDEGATVEALRFAAFERAGRVSGGLDLNAYCVSLDGPGARAVVPPNTTAAWGCTGPHGRHPIALGSACRWQYTSTREEFAYRAPDDVFSGYCFGPPIQPHARLLGRARIRNRDCARMHGRHGLRAKRLSTARYAPDAAYGWRCIDRSGEALPFDFTAACRFQFRDAGAIAAPDDIHDARSWRCYGAPLLDGGTTPASVPPVQKTRYLGVISDYPNWVGGRESLNAWEGSRSVFLHPDLPPGTSATSIVTYLDSCTSLYHHMSRFSKYPAYPNFVVPDKTSVAVVSDTCGAGCGASGKAEILASYDRHAICAQPFARTSLPWRHPLAYSIGTYELGRGVYTWPDKFAPVPLAVAFPEYVSNRCRRSLGITDAEMTELASTYGEACSPGQYRERFLDTELTFVEMMTTGAHLPPDLDRERVIMAVLYGLHEAFGFGFMTRFFEAAQRYSEYARSPEEVAERIETLAGEIEPATRAYLRSEWRFP